MKASTAIAKPAPPLNQQIIWLSGASSGIGAALARQLAPLCRQLIISGRNQSALLALKAELDAISAQPLLAQVCDITDIDQCWQLSAEIQHRFQHLDCLIANAGVCQYIDMADFRADIIAEVINTNVVGLANCVEAALPLLRLSQRGYIAGMSSSVAWLPLPRAQAYGSSKAAVEYLLESLKLDLHSENIDVSVICPGFVQTPLTDGNDFPMPARISSEEAADAILQGLEQRHWQIHFPKRFTRTLKFIAALPAPLRQFLTTKLSRNKASPAKPDNQLDANG